MAATNGSWSCLAFMLTVFTVCQGSHGSRGRTAGPAVLRPVILLETEQSLSSVPGLPGPPAVDDVALIELDQLLNLFQGKGKRSQDQPDKGCAWAANGRRIVLHDGYCNARGVGPQGLTRDLVTQVLQPGGAGMWFGPRLGRRRRSAPAASALRRKRSLQDGDVDNDIPWKLAEILKELQGPKRSPSLCDQTDINCLLASITSNSAAFAPEQQQRSRSEGNLVNFTPRLGRGSGEQSDDGGLYRLDAESGDASGATARQLRTDTDPLWFSPRLGRRLLPLGTMDVHGPAGAPPTPQRQPAHPQPRGLRAARSAEEAADSVGQRTQGKPDQHDQASQEHIQV